MINNLYQKAIHKKERIKELEERIYSELGNTEVNSLISSNKIILKKFISQFSDEIKAIKKALPSSSYENNSEKPNNNNSNAGNNLSTLMETQANVQNSSFNHENKETPGNKEEKFPLTQQHLSKSQIK